MAFNPAPTSMFPAYTSDGTLLSLDLDDANLSAANAHTSTGDIRAILRGILDRAFMVISALPTADKPKKMSITKGAPQVVGTNVLRQTYTVTFDTTYQNTALTMAPEE